MKFHVLVIDDEFSMRQTIKLILDEKYHIFEAEDEPDALQILEKVKIDIVLLDIHLGNTLGTQLLPKIRTLEPESAVIMVTVEQDVQRVVECMRLGATDYITKPFTENELLRAVGRAQTELELKQAQNFISWEVDEQSRHFDMVGTSREMMELYQKIQQISNVDTSILITGETGVGKEMVARALHRIGVRSQKPFIPVNCAAIPVTLLESELFGYEPGAFTGAKDRKRGMFELANRGTIFLDEISELNLEAQVKLLRVLQVGEFTRLGGTQILHTDVVVYATSNRNLLQMIQEGKFRADLFYRLNVVEIIVPSLIDRREDIPLLINHFIKKHSQHLKIKPKSIDPFAIAILQNNMEWKGNVRELENSVLRALVFSKNEIIQLPDFAQSETAKPEMQELLPFIIQKISTTNFTKVGIEKLRRELQMELTRLIDQQLLERLKMKYNGNLNEMITNSGIGRTYIYKIIRRAGYTPEQLKM